MKNLIQINTISKCYFCNVNSFFCLTHKDEYYVTCPLCCEKDFLSQQINNKYNFLHGKDDDNRSIFMFCSKCKIMFSIGCKHLDVECTNSIYNAHLIGEWLDLKTNERYIGMPYFDDENEWFEKACNIKVIEFICPNNNLICIKSVNKNNCNLKKIEK